MAGFEGTENRHWGSSLKAIHLYRPHPKDWYGETKQYLYRVRDGWRRVEMMRMVYEEVCSDTGISPDELHRKLAKAEQDMERVTGEVVSLLNAIPDRNQRTVMTMRYINGANWDQISDAMGMPKDDVKRMHQTALPILKRVLNRIRETGHKASVQ